MTTQEIIDLAAQFDLITFGPQDLVMFAREIEKRTIERCAKVCDYWEKQNHVYTNGAIRCGKDIRALDVPEVRFGNMGETDER